MTRASLLLASALALLAGCATAPEPAPPAPVVAEAPQPPPPPAEPAASAPAAVATDPVRPEIPVDLDDRSARRDLWERVRTGFAMSDLDGKLVEHHERWYSGRPDYVQRMTERGSRYLFHIVEEVTRRGLPTELALLPFIESAFNPQALSRARASGMWQFMPATGAHYDLAQNMFRDDRRNVLESTRAALDYLQQLHGMFGDWHLALAAYNWGEGNVKRAIAYNRKRGRPADYASLRMPAETRHYVPKLQAVKNLVARPGDFGLELPVLDNHPYFLTVPIERDIDVDLVMELAEIDPETFHQLNPQWNKPVILAAGSPVVLLPYDNANAFVRNLASREGPYASWTAWVAPATLKPADAAKRVGMSEEELRDVNRIPPRMLIKAGSTLLVPRNGHGADVAEHIAENGSLTLAPEAHASRRIVFKAGRKGISVAAVAKRYRVNAASVAHWNGVTAGTRFAPGTRITVYVQGKPKHKSAKRPVVRKASKAKGGGAPGKAAASAAKKR